MSAAKQMPKTTAAESAGIAFAQLKANGKLVLDEDGKRWAGDVEVAIGEAEDETNALGDALEGVRATLHKVSKLHMSPMDALLAISIAAEDALRLAGRLP